MALNIPRNYSAGNPLTEAHLDAAFDAVEDQLDVTKISSSQIQDNAIDTQHLAAGAVDATALDTDAVTTAKILNDAVDETKIEDNIALQGNCSTTGNFTVGDAATDTLTVGGSSGITLTYVTTAAKTGLSSSGATDALFYPGGSGSSAIKAVSNKAMHIYDPTNATTYPAIVSPDPGGGEALRMIRGEVSSGGAITTGEGFSVVNSGTGEWDITFSTAFAAAPVVVCSPLNGTLGKMCTFQNPTTTSVEIYTWNDSGAAQTLGFSFIAIGTR